MALEHALVLTFSLFGGLTFVEADLPGVRVDWNVLGQVLPGFRHADFDGDGTKDLLTARQVALQRDGEFPENARLVLPPPPSSSEAASERPFCDLWDRALYLRYEGALRIVTWEEGVWSDQLDQAIAWPTAPTNARTSTMQPYTPGEGVRLERFLHDLNGDDTPEIVLADRDGMHVYELEAGEYAETCVLPVHGPLRLHLERDLSLWPPEERRLRLPTHLRGGNIVLDGPALLILRRERLSGTQCLSEVMQYRVKEAEESGFELEKTGRTVVELRSDAVHCRLNEDDAVDYVAYDSSESKGLPVGCPVLDTFISTDAGRTFQAFRFQGFMSNSGFVDFDSDGDEDLVTGPTRMLAGGLRETVGRMLTRQSFEHEVHVRLQDARGVFSSKPDVKGRFTIHCDHPLFQEEVMLTRYQMGRLFNFSGDFDGDGYGDLLIHEQPNRLAVYLSEGRGFQKKPEVVIPVVPRHHARVADIDGDGRSDIHLIWGGEFLGGEADSLREKVLLSREVTP